MSLNLHASANSLITAVNANEIITLNRNTGYTTAADGTRTAVFSAYSGPAQIQPVSNNELTHLSQLNIEGDLKSVYLYGQWFGIIRADATGGDLLNFDGYDWMVVQHPESYPGWSRVVVARQVNQTPT